MKLLWFMAVVLSTAGFSANLALWLNGGTATNLVVSLACGVLLSISSALLWADR